MDKNIVVEAYNPAWEAHFAQLKEFYLLHLSTLITGVEHVGSTSVPGLASKPIIDIDLVIENDGKLPQVIAALQELGYKYLGDLGIKDRYAFRVDPERAPAPATDPAWPRHNLYCCPQNSMGLRNHLTLRTALRNDPALREYYGQLKQKLASQTDDIDEYVERKSAFIAQVLLENGFSHEDASDIVVQNRKE